MVERVALDHDVPGSSPGPAAIFIILSNSIHKPVKDLKVVLNLARWEILSC